LPGFAQSAVSPNRRWQASVDSNGISVTDRRTGRTRLLTADTTSAMAWAPDSRSLAYITGKLDWQWAATGDIKIVSLNGRTRTVVSQDGAYGGQIVALTWTRPPPRTTYRRPQTPEPGIFTGAPVAHLAATGTHVAFTACNRLYAWEPFASTATEVSSLGQCLDPDNRNEYYDVELAGTRLFWGEKTAGLSYDWSLHELTLGTNSSVTLVSGDGVLGSPEESGAGAITGQDDLIVFGDWQRPERGPNGLTTETLFRVTSLGCPCTAIAYAAAPSTTSPLVPLDTDGTRIAALRYGSIVVLDAAGNDLLQTTLPAGGAQIMGNELLVLVEGQLRDYDLKTGALRQTWTAPSGSVGRDCDFYSEPHCPTDAAVKLQDAARGLVAYTFNGQVHVVRLADGRDTAIGYGTEARFMDSGLAYADAARLNIIPYSGLGA
jgi:hypothetical protein